jgi:hypothetical protein
MGSSVTYRKFSDPRARQQGPGSSCVFLRLHTTGTGRRGRAPKMRESLGWLHRGRQATSTPLEREDGQA